IYDFFIITSPGTYSCGTALPYYAQKYGWATIMGVQPSGGDCAVASYIDCYGLKLVMSGFIKLGSLTDGEFISDETAVVMDIPYGDMADEYYFNRPAAVELIHEYQQAAE
ncbi:MAG: hypothetical protein HUJ76_11465, partial [Parasporobacterium sp.]|nr:hypothetical protein [Parasporobacterium sp.]